MKILFETWLMKNIKPHCHIELLLCSVSFPGVLAPCELKLWPRLHQWAKTPGFWWNTPGENAANSLWTESLGPMAGEIVVKSCGCCDDPCTPRDLNNSHTCHPNIPQHSAQGLSPQGIAAPPQGGVNRHLMLQPPKQPGPEFKFARGHGTRGRPQHRFFGLTVGHG